MVVKHGDKMIIPVHMTIEAAIEFLMRELEASNKIVVIQEEFDAFPWDGAAALQRVLCERFGSAQATETIRKTLSGEMKEPPTILQIETDYGKTEPVVWGSFSLPGIPGRLTCHGVKKEGGRVIFGIKAEVKRRHEDFVKSILVDVRHELKVRSIYRGKAVRINFEDSSGQTLNIPEIKFLNPRAVEREQLILSQDLMDAVETNLFTPIRRVRELVANGISVKRGVLLGGTYGTGKTLTAAVASGIAVEAGVMYLNIGQASQLSRAIAFARQYAEPACVIFCEDVDRVTNGRRDVEMDQLLNTIDGIDSKGSNIIVVLTSNSMENIDQAMLRPGRLDAVLEFVTPDARAVEKLLRYYGDGCILEDLDLTEVGKVLAGCIPAVVEEVVKRAKLAQLKVTPRGQLVGDLSVAALLESARTMQHQLGLLNREKKPEAAPSFETLVHEGVKQALSDGAGDQLAQDISESVVHALR